MKFLSSLAALFTGGSPSVNDLDLEIVAFDPPDGSTLLAGEQVKVTVRWRHSMRGRGVGIWTKPVPPDGVGGSYESDAGEAHRPGQGQVLRGFSVDEPAVVDAMLLVAKDGDSRELFQRRVPVHFTFAVNPEREARRDDGATARITSVAVRAPAEGLLPLGTHVEVRVGYVAQSTHGLRVAAVPVTDVDMRFMVPAEIGNGEGEALQGFVVGQAGVVRQVHVRLLNAGGVAVDERWVDVDLRFGS